MAEGSVELPVVEPLETPVAGKPAGSGHLQMSSRLPDFPWDHLVSYA